MSELSEKSKTPAIRFKGFSGEWVFCELGKNAIIKGRLGWKSLKQNEYLDNGPAMIAGRHISNGIINWNEVDHIPKWRYYESPEIMLRIDDVIFSKDGSLGNPSIIKKLNGQATINSTMMLVRPSNNLNSYFFYQILSTIRFHNLIKLKVSGSSIPHLFQADMNQFSFYFPKSKKEQTQIGNFFQQLDRLIAQHQQKHDKLLSVKKALLEKMFPKQGETQPAIRFKGFSEAWEEKALGDVLEYERPDEYIVTSTDYSKEYETPVLTANKAFILGYTNETNTYKQPSIIFDDFTLDRKFVYFPFMVKSSALKILTIKNRSIDNLQFVFNLLNTTNIEIMGHARHYISVVQPTVVLTPKIKEQTKIGNLFQQLDSLISQQQSQVTKLGNIKQAMLAKMFV